MGLNVMPRPRGSVTFFEQLRYRVVPGHVEPDGIQAHLFGLHIAAPG